MLLMSLNFQGDLCTVVAVTVKNRLEGSPWAASDSTLQWIASQSLSAIC